MEMLETKCPLCGSTGNYTAMYKSNFSLSDLNPEVFSARRLPDLIHYQVVRCNNDKLVRSSPVCDDLSVQALYKSSKFSYAENINNLTASYLKVLNKVLTSLSKEAVILEVGCGNGFVLSALLDKGYKNLYGVEPGADAVSKADEKIKGRISSHVLKDGIYKNESFDFVFFFQTLDHIQDPVRFLTTCYNLLSPGGSILALNHDVESLSARLLKEKSPIIDIEHTYLYSKETIGKIFFKTGFVPVEIFSPNSCISIKYLIWLFPLPKVWKLKLLNLKGKLFDALLNQKMWIPLGNLCIIANKPGTDK